MARSVSSLTPKVEKDLGLCGRHEPLIASSHSGLDSFPALQTPCSQSKVVLLEDLASQVGLRTQDTINRIQDLLADGTLTGVIDDRGKFIYITPEELAAVANFIRQRGRVSITELAQASNSLIAWGQEPPAQAPA
uniref:DDRGK domain-containing protein 1 n=1 Tax=Pipistrellus kuhlii TaxID=59472 RepID=A0A7J7Y7Z4_PIPKU|nr:DDRGK domain containing 1 [Pipistrellus kuhlii]